jgi:preprotein translocase subunit YajC
MLAFLIFLADQQQTDDKGSGLPNPMFLVIWLLVLFYFFMIRPARKQEKDRVSLVNTLKKGDRVLTNAGIIATIASIKEKDEEVHLKIDDNSPVRLCITKSSIVRKVTEDEEKKDKDKEEG